MSKNERRLYLLHFFLFFGFIIAGLLVDGPDAVFRGFIELQVHPARLLNDYTLAGGSGAALLNASLVALIGLGLVRLNDIRLSGPTIAAVFTLFGFGLFGKTPINILPVISGVYIAAGIAGKKFRDYIIIALFGTALAPLVSLLAFELTISPVYAFPLAIAGGVLAGVLLPSVAIVMLRLHQGYSLYNIGLTTGFLALFSAALVFGRGTQLPGAQLWNTSPGPLLVFLVPAMSLILLFSGLFGMGNGASGSFRRLLKLPGRLPSDFMSLESAGGTLINMGLLGLVFWGYCMVSEAPLNGPVIGGIFTVIGFGAFGKHLRNVWPIVAGVIISALVFGFPLNTPGVVLAVLFGTTLAPIAGEFGVLMGIMAGFIHFLMVMRTGNWHAGIGLYNNGFAGGLTATLLVAIIEWVRTNRYSDKIRRDGSYRAKEESKK